MKEIEEKYLAWKNNTQLDKDLHIELAEIKDNYSAIEDRFGRNLQFGTGGLRGLIGAGTNRINIYTIRKATLGLANYLLQTEMKSHEISVVIAYDSRKYSNRFAEEAAKVLANKGIKVYLFTELKPTPILSFAVRQLNASAGIVITASHNTAVYNGYKVYNSQGGQITEAMASAIYREIEKIDDILNIETFELEVAINQKMIEYIGDEIDKAYGQCLEKILLNPELIRNEGEQINIVYSAVHGTGNKPIRHFLNQFGFTNVFSVKEQEQPDSTFSTVKSPNPEEKAVFELALALAKEKNADIIMATDPDADRIGVMIKTGKDFMALNGNQLGAIILHYIITQKSLKGVLPKNGVIIKTIVTSDLGLRMAAKYHLETENTLTGFKYIGEKIEEYTRECCKQFLFGYEESYGYLIGDFVRDKDAVQASIMVAEMTLYYKRIGKTLFDVLNEIYQEFNYYIEDLETVTLHEKTGEENIKDILALFRSDRFNLQGFEVEVKEDYLYSKATNLLTGQIKNIYLPKSNVIKIILTDGSWFAIRPSGTEPKLKFYFSVNSKTQIEADAKLKQLKGAVLGLIDFQGGK